MDESHFRNLLGFGKNGFDLGEEEDEHGLVMMDEGFVA